MKYTLALLSLVGAALAQSESVSSAVESASSAVGSASSAVGSATGSASSPAPSASGGAEGDYLQQVLGALT